SSAAAHATACAWFPADHVTTPRSRSSGVSAARRLSAPRALNEPVFWNSSALSETPRALEPKVGVRWIRPASTARACSTSSRETLIGRPLPNERVEGAWGNREVPPHKTKEGGNVGERARGERRSRRKCLARGDLRHAEA